MLVLAGCGGEPSPRRTTSPTASSTISPTASPSATPGPGKIRLPDPGPGAKLGWKTALESLPAGRSYYLAIPTCTGSPGCAAWLATPRKLVIWLHGVGQSETPTNAGLAFQALGRTTRDVVPAFGVAAASHHAWDAGMCCTFAPVDDLGYLDALVDDAAGRTPIARDRVGLTGASNGGLLATRAICTQPDRYRAIAIWAASWQGSCDKAPVTIGHWHGDADTVVRLHGGPLRLGTHVVNFPPADWLEKRLAPGSEFRLTVVPGASHVTIPSATVADMMVWLDEHL